MNGEGWLRALGGQVHGQGQQAHPFPEALGRGPVGISTVISKDPGNEESTYQW